MGTKSIGSIVVIIFIASCGQSTAVTSVPATPANTTIPTNPVLPSPTNTSTQFPSLSEKGPYMLLHKGLSDGIGIYDVQEFGRKFFSQLSLKNSVYYNPVLLEQLVSPDGKWFAYHTFNGKIKTLNLFNLSNGGVTKIADVIPDDSTQRLMEVEKQLPGIYPDLFSADEEVSVELGFRDGIHTVAWSPDSRYLAFAAQINGLSSDVYVYDLDVKNIRRLNDDLLNVEWISWSSDGQYILLFNDIPGFVYSGRSLHVLQSNSSGVKDPETYKTGHWWLTTGWLSSRKIFIAHHGDGGSWYDLNYFDIETKQMKSLWPNNFESFAVDVENQKIALSTVDGLYFIGLDGNTKMASESVYWYIKFRGGSKFRFIANDGEKILGISHDGSSTFLSNKGESLLWSVSPDYKWLVIYDKDGLELFNIQDELIKTISIAARNISWHPNSSGFFLSSWNKLYYVTVPDGELIFVDSCEIDDCDFELFRSTWLP